MIFGPVRSFVGTIFRNFGPYHVPYRKKIRSGTDFFVPKSVPRTVPGSSPDQNPYHVPDHEISDQKSVPRTKFRTGSDFWFGTAVHGQVGQIKQPFDM